MWTIRNVLKYFISLAITSTISWPTYAQETLDDLLKAIKLNDLSTVRVAVSKGMDVDSSDANGNTLLMLSTMEGNFDIVRFLLNQKARVRARNAYGDSALMLAALKGHLEIAHVLVAYGGEVNPKGWTPLHYCASEGKTETCRFLLEQSADVNALSANGTSALMMAARAGRFDTARLLTQHKADPKFRNDSGATALSWALKDGNTDFADLLRRAGARD